MSDIVRFLLARITDDEKAVDVFSGKHWTFDGGDVRDDVQDNPYTTWGNTVLEVGFEGVCQNGLEEHVARWDPARVLAECAAKRAIIDVHKNATWTIPNRETDGREYWHNSMDSSVEVRLNGRYERTITTTDYLQEAGAVKNPPDMELCALAAVYKNHPDYQPEWEST